MYRIKNETIELGLTPQGVIATCRVSNLFQDIICQARPGGILASEMGGYMALLKKLHHDGDWIYLDEIEQLQMLEMFEAYRFNKVDPQIFQVWRALKFPSELNEDEDAA